MRLRYITTKTNNLCINDVPIYDIIHSDLNGNSVYGGFTIYYKSFKIESIYMKESSHIEILCIYCKEFKITKHTISNYNISMYYEDVLNADLDKNRHIKIIGNETINEVSLVSLLEEYVKDLKNFTNIVWKLF